MLPLALLTALVAAAAAQTPSLGACPKAVTQTTFDLEKYLGTWYEIYSFPTTFEKGNCARAEYKKLPNGHIQITNRGIEAGNKTITAIGDAYQPNITDPAKFLIRFASGAPYGNYWVITTDYTDHALIYSCDVIAKVVHIEFAWILARNMTLPEATTKKLFDELASFKVDVSKFKATVQTGCPP